MLTEVGLTLRPKTIIQKKKYKRNTFADCSLEKQKWLQGNADLPVTAKCPQNGLSTDQPQPHHLVNVGSHTDQNPL